MKTTSNSPELERSPARPNTVWGISPEGFPGIPQDWVTDWETFSADGGSSQLFSTYHHRAQAPIRRVLAIMHGHGEHGGRYLHFAHYLSGAVDGIYVWDHRGHGRSEGLKGHAEHFDLLVDDSAKSIRLFAEKHPNVEIHLLGHSMGGHLALRLLHQHPDLPLASATISAPFLALKAEVPTAKKMAAGLLSRVWGSLELSTGLDAHLVSRDPAVVRAYLKDRLVHDKMTPQFYSTMTQCMRGTLKHVENGHTLEFKLPTQFLIPGDDRIVDGEVAVQFAEKLRAPDKRIKIYAGYYHEAFNDLGKEQVFEDIGTWIQTHSKT